MKISNRFIAVVVVTMLGVLLSIAISLSFTTPISASGSIELFASGLWGPFGMAFDSAGDLFVANEGDGGGGTAVSRVTPTGEVSTFATGFVGPSGVAFNGTGDLHVSDDTNRVFRVSGTGIPQVFIDSDVGLENPNAIAFDASDNLYVANAGSGFISKFDAAGMLIDLELATGFITPESIVVDDNAGVLFISDVSGKIYQVDKNTGSKSLYVETFEFTDGGLARDSEGDLYLSAYDDGVVLRIKASDRSVTTCLSGISRPRGLVFDAAGRLYVTSYDTGQIFRADKCEFLYIYLPMVLKNFEPPPTPPLPPVLDDISNSDGDGNYTVSWSAVTGATSYTLQEDDNSAFSSPVTVYSGPNTSKSITGRVPGTYYYRVRASANGLTSNWSNSQSVQVMSLGPEPGHYTGTPSVSFDVTADVQVCNYDITVPFGIGSCRIRPASCAEITDNDFTFSQAEIGAIYEITGTFDTQTHALGGYRASMCGDTLILPPSEGTWEASK
jgi:sugar lactone lactonase YvrE